MPLDNEPDHSGVTDEDLEGFFNEHPGIRPLNPLNGADPNLPIQFQSGSGRHVPPAGGVEDSANPPSPSSTVSDGNGDEGGEGGETPPTPPGDGEPAPPPPPSPTDVPDPNAPLPPPPPPAVEYVEFDGQQIPASQLRALLDWQQNFAGDPELQALVTGHLVGRAAPVEGGAPTTPAAGVGTPAAPAAGQPSAFQPLTPPEDVDLEDPAIAALWGIIQQQHGQIAQLSTGVQQTMDAHVANARANSQSVYKRAAESFRNAHELDDNDINILSQVASRLQILPALMQGIDPLTGVAVRPDPLAAVERALEIAYFTVPEYRSREFQRSVKQQQGDAQRKKNLAAVGGTAGSAARTTTPARPGTPESRQEMVKEVAAMMNGEWTGDNNN